MLTSYPIIALPLRRKAARVRRYSPPVKYTPEQLLDFEILDLETDIRCALKDKLLDYAEECQKKLEELKVKRETQKNCLTLSPELKIGITEIFCFDSFPWISYMSHKVSLLTHRK